MKITLIDNYDSFTFNLVHLVAGFGPEVTVVRNDAASAAELLRARPGAIMISPGPRTPGEAGISCDIIRESQGRMPILGICLGHQAIGEVYGGRIVRTAPMHGKVAKILHGGKTLFEGLGGAIEATRYHSLVIDRATCPPELEVTAETEDGLIMAASHRKYPVHGVQFHPESIKTPKGGALIANFLALAKQWNARYRND